MNIDPIRHKHLFLLSRADPANHDWVRLIEQRKRNIRESTLDKHAVSDILLCDEFRKLEVEKDQLPPMISPTWTTFGVLSHQSIKNRGQPDYCRIQ